MNNTRASLAGLLGRHGVFGSLTNGHYYLIGERMLVGRWQVRHEVDPQWKEAIKIGCSSWHAGHMLDISGGYLYTPVGKNRRFRRYYDGQRDDEHHCVVYQESGLYINALAAVERSGQTRMCGSAYPVLEVSKPPVTIPLVSGKWNITDEQAAAYQAWLQEQIAKTARKIVRLGGSAGKAI